MVLSALAGGLAAAPAALAAPNDRLEPPEPRWEGAPAFVRTPPGVKPGRLYPLVVALHGNSGRAEKYVNTVAPLSTPKLPCFILAPEYQTRPEFGAPLYEDWEKLAVHYLEQVLEKYPIDRSRIVVEGFSMGGGSSGRLTYKVWGATPEDCPWAAVCMHGGMAAPWRRGDRGQGSPKIPYLLILGEQETNVLGKFNIVKEARAVHRVLLGLGHDVRYHELPDLGHTVKPPLLEFIREILADLPDYGAAMVRLRSAREWAGPALAHCDRGRFAEALQALDALEPTEKRAAKVRKVLRGFLARHAKTEPVRIGQRFSTVAYDRYLVLAGSLKDDEKLGPLFAGGVKAMGRMRGVKPELMARERYEAACTAADPKAALAELAASPLKVTRFGRRAAGHALALEPAPGP